MSIKKYMELQWRQYRLWRCFAQPLDKAKLDQLFDRLSEKNKAMGSLTIAKQGKRNLQPRYRIQPDQRRRKEIFECCE
jgi:CRISPR/Cas system-associated endoribonuclease Cas2